MGASAFEGGWISWFLGLAGVVGGRVTANKKKVSLGKYFIFQLILEYGSGQKKREFCVSCRCTLYFTDLSRKYVKSDIHFQGSAFYSQNRHFTELYYEIGLFPFLQNLFCNSTQNRKQSVPVHYLTSTNVTFLSFCKERSRSSSKPVPVLSCR